MVAGRFSLAAADDSVEGDAGLIDHPVLEAVAAVSGASEAPCIAGGLPAEPGGPFQKRKE